MNRYLRHQIQGHPSLMFSSHNFIQTGGIAMRKYSNSNYCLMDGESEFQWSRHSYERQELNQEPVVAYGNAIEDGGLRKVHQEFAGKLRKTGEKWKISIRHPLAYDSFLIRLSFIFPYLLESIDRRQPLMSFQERKISERNHFGRT